MEYVDNKKFYEAIVERKALLKKAEEEEGKPIPQISNYLCECIMLIANNFSNRPNFYNYPFKEELIGDGIENCILYFDKFDIEKSKNPFSYFTQIIFFAFLRRIKKEKVQFYIRHKIIQSIDEDELDLQNQDIDTEYKNAYREFLKDMTNVELPEEPVKVQKQPKYVFNPLEDFIV